MLVKQFVIVTHFLNEKSWNSDSFDYFPTEEEIEDEIETMSQRDTVSGAEVKTFYVRVDENGNYKA